MPALPDSVRVVEVGPRDGLQHEPATVPVEGRVRLIEALADAGLPAVEVGSFVSPTAIPQLADTGEVVRRLRRRPGTSYLALVPNRRGLERAIEAGLAEVALFTAASEEFNRHNISATIAESIARFREVMPLAREAGVRVRGYVSTAWWCPYTGRVRPDDARRVTLDLVELGCDEVSLGDTIGAATPLEVGDLLELVLRDVAPGRLAVHFHDTRGTALANVLASLERGISIVDASIGGLGGCPYAPGATGNLATEDLLYMLHGMGIATGVDLERVRDAAHLAAGLVEHALPSRYAQAGPPAGWGLGGVE